MQTGTTNLAYAASGRPRAVRAAALAICVLGLVCCTGCPVVSNLPAPGKVQTLRDPQYGREYHLYVPTRYANGQRLPLVVTCHGTRPFDCATAQMEEWKGIAEQKGFLVAAPELEGASALTTGKPEEQIERQLDDEKAILSMVRAIRAARSVDDTRVFLTGWSAGNYAVLFTGLRHPEVFRALSCRQGNFKEEYVQATVPFLDPYQSIQVTYADLDLLKDDATKCIEWLHKHDMDPAPLEQYSGHKRDPEPVCSFFMWVVRNRPWVRVDVKEDPADEMRVTLSARASFVPAKYLWEFGDGLTGAEDAPTHRYEKPGTYRVRVQLGGEGKSRVVRQVQIQVPRVRLGAAPATMPGN